MKWRHVVLLCTLLLIVPAYPQTAPYSPFCSSMDSTYNETPYFCGDLGPFSPINITRNWTVNCNFQGAVTATQMQRLSGTGTCGIGGIIGVPECPPMFKEIIGLSPDANYHTWRGQVTNRIYAGFCASNGGNLSLNELRCSTTYCQSCSPCNLPGNGTNGGSCNCVCPDSCPPPPDPLPPPPPRFATCCPKASLGDCPSGSYTSCNEYYCEWDCTAPSPIVLDISGDGFHLSPTRQTVWISISSAMARRSASPGPPKAPRTPGWSTTGTAMA